MNYVNAQTIQNYQVALLELKHVLDHVYCFSQGTLGLPLTENTKCCLLELPKAKFNATSLRNIRLFKEHLQKQSAGQFDLSPKTKTNMYTRKLNPNIRDESLVAELKLEVKKKDGQIARLEEQLDEQSRDIQDLEEEMRENQRQIFQLRENIRQKKLKKYTEASDIAGLKRNSSLLSKPVKRGQRPSFVKRDSIYIRHSNTKYAKGSTENFDLDLNVTKSQIGKSQNKSTEAISENVEGIPISNSDAQKAIPTYLNGIVLDTSRLSESPTPNFNGSRDSSDDNKSFQMKLTEPAQEESSGLQGSSTFTADPDMEKYTNMKSLSKVSNPNSPESATIPDINIDSSDLVPRKSTSLNNKIEMPSKNPIPKPKSSLMNKLAKLKLK